MESVKAMAGPHSQTLIPDALVCSICQELMLYPYCASCGHTFCGQCLKHWLVDRQQNQNDKTCPQCRAKVTTVPVLVHALRELSLHVLNALKEADPQRAEELAELAAPDPGPHPFKEVLFAGQIRDADDGVDRCEYCLWEIEDGECTNCGRAQDEDLSDVAVDYDVSADEEPNSDDLAFIDDDNAEVVDIDSDDQDAISNIMRRGALAGPRRVINIDSDDDDDEEDEEDDANDDDEVVSVLSDDSQMRDEDARMPIVISDSSSVISSSGEED